MFEYQSRAFGTLHFDKRDIGSFNFEALFEIIQDPSLSDEGLNEINLLIDAAFQQAESVLDENNVAMTHDPTQNYERVSEPVNGHTTQAWIDLYLESTALQGCIFHLRHARELGRCVSLSTLTDSLMGFTQEVVMGSSPAQARIKRNSSLFDDHAGTLLDEDRTRRNMRFAPVSKSGDGSVQGARLIARVAKRALDMEKRLRPAKVTTIPEQVINLTLDSDGSTSDHDDDTENDNGNLASQTKAGAGTREAADHSAARIDRRQAPSSVEVDDDVPVLDSDRVLESCSLVTNDGSCSGLGRRKEDPWRNKLKRCVDWMDNDQDLERRIEQDVPKMFPREEWEDILRARRKRGRVSSDPLGYADLTGDDDCPSSQRTNGSSISSLRVLRMQDQLIEQSDEEDEELRVLNALIDRHQSEALSLATNSLSPLVSESPATERRHSTTSTATSASPLSKSALTSRQKHPSASSTSGLKVKASIRLAREQIWDRHVPCCEHQNCKSRGYCLPPDFDSRQERCQDCAEKHRKCLATFWLTSSRVARWSDALTEWKIAHKADLIAYGDDTEHFGVPGMDKITDYSSVLPRGRSSSTAVIRAFESLPQTRGPLLD